MSLADGDPYAAVGLFTPRHRSDIIVRNGAGLVAKRRRMEQIAEWLAKLGLSEYAGLFAENNISALRYLTDQDLKDIGIPLGHRRIMEAAISERAGPAAPEAAKRMKQKPQDAAERRQVTVLFSDLVGSTALATRMDPEDLRELISAYQKCVAETVSRFGGFVAKYMGVNATAKMHRLARAKIHH